MKEDETGEADRQRQTGGRKRKRHIRDIKETMRRREGEGEAGKGVNSLHLHASSARKTTWLALFF